MYKVAFDGARAAKTNRIELLNGYAFNDCYIDPWTDAPAGFIAIRPCTVTEGEPALITLVKVSNIAFISVEEQEAGKVWQQLNPIPETVAAKSLY